MAIGKVASIWRSISLASSGSGGLVVAGKSLAVLTGSMYSSYRPAMTSEKS